MNTNQFKIGVYTSDPETYNEIYESLSLKNNCIIESYCPFHLKAYNSAISVEVFPSIYNEEYIKDKSFDYLAIGDEIFLNMNSFDYNLMSSMLINQRIPIQIQSFPTKISKSINISK